jgi:hypothetical protein
MPSSSADVFKRAWLCENAVLLLWFSCGGNYEALCWGGGSRAMDAAARSLDDFIDESNPVCVIDVFVDALEAKQKLDRSLTEDA